MLLQTASLDSRLELREWLEGAIAVLGRGADVPDALRAVARMAVCIARLGSKSLDRSREGRTLRSTFELSGRRWQDASARMAKMYRVPPAGRWWPAVGAPLERGVRPHRATNSMIQLVSHVLPPSPENACSQMGLCPGFACHVKRMVICMPFRVS